MLNWHNGLPHTTMEKTVCLVLHHLWCHWTIRTFMSSHVRLQKGNQCIYLTYHQNFISIILSSGHDANNNYCDLCCVINYTGNDRKECLLHWKKKKMRAKFCICARMHTLCGNITRVFVYISLNRAHRLSHVELGVLYSVIEEPWNL